VGAGRGVDARVLEEARDDRVVAARRRRREREDGALLIERDARVAHQHVDGFEAPAFARGVDHEARGDGARVGVEESERLDAAARHPRDGCAERAFVLALRQRRGGHEERADERGMITATSMSRAAASGEELDRKKTEPHLNEFQRPPPEPVRAEAKAMLREGRDELS
jgi:hypothetical protein